MTKLSARVSRRRFLGAAAVGPIATIAAPAILCAGKVDQPIVIGSGEHQYEVIHHYPRLPDQFTWQTTHNVAVDAAQNLYVIHEGDVKKKDHPAIFVFDPSGKYIRSFGSQFQGGGHGLEIRQESGEEFLYVTGYKSIKSLAKLTLRGEQIWKLRAPMESGMYRDGEDQGDSFGFQRDRFLPTNFAFLPDGGFMLADGYGSYYIHRYDKNARWVSCFGGAGSGGGKFNTPHGLTLDDRDADHPVIVVADRANNALQRFTLDGKYLNTIEGFGLPANVQVQGDLMLVPELYARLSILGKDNQVVARLGDDSERLKADKRKQIRVSPSRWIDGKFITPHDACFDAAGNIYVAEYVPKLGRVTKLRKLS
jgi:hypothetical protein